jgi:hypothetical protein
MKRIGNLFDKIVDMDNLRLAHYNAKKGKAHYREVKVIECNPEFYLKQIQDSLISKMFSTSEYIIATINDGKKMRTIHKLPYFPDRIIQHALIQIIDPVISNSFIRDTFQSIKGRGTSDARRRVAKGLKEHKPKYCLQIDVVKYYPSVDNDILKSKIRTKIKCEDTLWLIDDIIDSVQGLPIGNYTSQLLGNFYLTEIDWKIKHKGLLYFRYCDDFIILSDDKDLLHNLKKEISEWLEPLKLNIKTNWQVYDIEKQGIDFVGYVFRHSKIRLRKTIAQSFKRSINSKENINSIMSYWGWIKPIQAIRLWKTNINKLQERFYANNFR